MRRANRLFPSATRHLDRLAVVVEPVDERAERRVFLIVHHGGVVERAHQTSLGTEEFQQLPVVDVEAKRARRRMKVRAVDENRDALSWMKIPGFRICLMLNEPAGCGGRRGRVLVWSMSCKYAFVVKQIREPIRGE